MEESPRVLHPPGQHLHQSRQRSRLCDRVLHGSERFSVTNSDVDRLQSTHSNSAFSEVGLGINQECELAFLVISRPSAHVTLLAICARKSQPHPPAQVSLGQFCAQI